MSSLLSVFFRTAEEGCSGVDSDLVILLDGFKVATLAIPNQHLALGAKAITSDYTLL
jgi:hypothetical protein